MFALFPIFKLADILTEMKSTAGLIVLRGAFLVFLVGGFSFLLLYLGLFDDGSREGGQRDWREAEEDVRLDGIHFKEWKHGGLVWILDAGEGKYHRGKQEGVFRDASLTFIPDSGGRVNLYADRVVYELGQRKLNVEGNVRGESEEGYRFYTDSLLCDVESREVETADRVVLKRDHLTIEGVGMRGSLLGPSIVLLSSVRAAFSPRQDAD